ncbi:MAG TPA: glucose-6-phosphate dehydrogenase, partial [Candidatus Kapabacteria bacterium]
MVIKPDPCVIVIFGGTGDLSHRKILPALFQMSSAGEMPEGTVILGIGRNEKKNDAGFRSDVRDSITRSGVNDSAAIDEWCKSKIFYQGIGKGTKANFTKLRSKIITLEKKQKLGGNRIFHLAIPPESFGPTAKSLGEVKLNKSEGWTRLVIEKPFGHDFPTAVALNKLLYKYFTEE